MDSSLDLEISRMELGQDVYCVPLCKPYLMLGVSAIKLAQALERDAFSLSKAKLSLERRLHRVSRRVSSLSDREYRSCSHLITNGDHWSNVAKCQGFVMKKLGLKTYRSGLKASNKIIAKLSYGDGDYDEKVIISDGFTKASERASEDVKAAMLLAAFIQASLQKYKGRIFKKVKKL